MLERIDVRRLITFGVIKGFLYRVHKYAIAPAAVKKPTHRSGKKNAMKGSFGGGGGSGGRSMGKEDRCTAKSRQPQDGDDENADKVDGTGIEGVGDKKADLSQYLDGTYCFDQICTELMISERELMGQLKTMGDVQIIHR